MNSFQLPTEISNEVPCNDTNNNLIHDTNLDLEKGSLPCSPKISESTTTINDFIPLSTITTINNDNKIPTGTPYHTSNDYNNVNDKDLS